MNMEKRHRKSKSVGGGRSSLPWFRWVAGFVVLGGLGQVSGFGQAAPSPQVRDLPPLRMHGEANLQGPIPEIRAPIERFFKDLLAGEIQRAFQELLVASRLSSRHDNVSVLMNKNFYFY
ncbi:MAG: hypothetical protein PHP75_00190 [Methylacidiphilaceae bacterium]|nr:hypothetical protein [Candidatus Methylacidiphilaceae bacterium]